MDCSIPKANYIDRPNKPPSPPASLLCEHCCMIEYRNPNRMHPQMLCLIATSIYKVQQVLNRMWQKMVFHSFYCSFLHGCLTFVIVDSCTALWNCGKRTARWIKTWKKNRALLKTAQIQPYNRFVHFRVFLIVTLTL